MKMRKNLFLMVIFLFTLTVMVVLPNKVFAEEMSNEFKEILNEDGKFVIKSSSKNITAQNIEEYISRKTNYKFHLATESVSEYPYWKYLIDDDLSKGTIRLSGSMDKPQEDHVVEFVYITEKSDEFKKLLNKDGKLVINSIKPSNEYEFRSVFELLVWKDGIDYSHISEDFSSCDLTFNDETHTVEIVYNYNNSIKDKLNGFVKSFPSNIEFFKVQDMELINYWVNTAQNESEEKDTFTYYSGELKSYLNNYNVTIQVDNRAGMDGALVTERLGIFLVKYNDITYYINNVLGARGEHIIYVPTTTGDSKEELMAAAQTRVDEYIGKDKVKLSYGGTAYDAWLKQEYEITRWMWEQDDPNMTFEQWKALGNVFIPTYEKFEEVINIKGVTETDSVFNVAIGDKSYYVIIKKDDAKMITPTYATADIATDVTISSTDTSIPLDTSIQAKPLTSGTEYEKIIKLLNVENSETFDLKLYSESLEKYITKLDDGRFEVKIPISKELEGKNLVVYYVDQNDKITEHEVIVKDGYAIFTTDHFSIYTLAEVKAIEDNKEDNKEENNGNITGDNSNNIESDDNKNSTGNTSMDNNITDNTNNPKTGDNIILFSIIFVIALSGILVTFIVNRKK